MARRRQERPDPLENVLIVEGNDDQHVMWSLFEAHRLPEVFAAELGGRNDAKRTGTEEGGYERLRENIRERLRLQNNKRIGIVVDADTNLEARWHSLRALFLEFGYFNTPLMPDPSGTIILPSDTIDAPEEARQTSEITIGIWIMPDNVLTGALEDFLQHLVPIEKTALWDHAEACVANLPIKPYPLTDNWRAKARIHSYLSWHESPGTPMGLAITKRYLTGDTEAARPFMNWLRRLFELDSAS